MKTLLVPIKKPDDLSINFILGQSHFIKTVEDLHETLITAVPNIKFGLAFCEASGSRLIRTSGTNKAMLTLATQNAKNIAAGHTFVIFLKDTFPINVLNQIKNVPEVCHIFCATANPTQVIIAEHQDPKDKTQQSRGVLGVLDGFCPLGTETTQDKKTRRQFLRDLGYKH